MMMVMGVVVMDVVVPEHALVKSGATVVHGVMERGRGRVLQPDVVVVRARGRHQVLQA